MRSCRPTEFYWHLCVGRGDHTPPRWTCTGFDNRSVGAGVLDGPHDERTKFDNRSVGATLAVARCTAVWLYAGGDRKGRPYETLPPILLLTM